MYTSIPKPPASHSERLTRLERRTNPVDHRLARRDQGKRPIDSIDALAAAASCAETRGLRSSRVSERSGDGGCLATNAPEDQRWSAPI